MWGGCWNEQGAVGGRYLGMRINFLAAVAVAMASGGVVLAQTTPPATAPTPTTPSTPTAPTPAPAATPDGKADPLGGPKVEQEAPKYSLVKTGFNGKLERITQPVEEATLAVLPLNAEEKAKVDAILVKRAAEIDKGIRESVPVLLRIQGVREEGLTTDRQAAIRELDKKLPMLRDRDAYRAEVRLALTPENAQRFELVMNEYMRAATMQASADAKAEGRKGNPFLMSVGESLRNVGLEVQQSYDRIVKEGTDKVERLIEIVQPTPEQEGAIRNLVTDFGQKSQMNPTPAQRGEFFKKLMGMLTIKQREALVGELYGKVTEGK